MIHLMHVLEVCQWNERGACIWKQENIKNTFHQDGEQFILQCLLNTSSNVVIPANYYLGLDNRTAIALTDQLASLSQEPTQFGYTRQAISSVNGFSVALDSNNNFRATSLTQVFSAVGGQWGPVRNLFLTNVLAGSGFLMASAALDNPRTVPDGQSLTVRISFALRDV